ncbi:MAG: hypothetical protein K6F46_06715 [Desulfovibrio sp.]|nr:hypothetical protein [Desulfovibrio sp.]
MIEVHFSCCDSSLDIKMELGIDVDFGYFIIDKIPGLRLVATDTQDDLYDNTYYWFLADNEEVACLQIQKLIGSYIRYESPICYNVKKINFN